MLTTLYTAFLPCGVDQQGGSFWKHETRPARTSLSISCMGFIRLSLCLILCFGIDWVTRPTCQARRDEVMPSVLEHQPIFLACLPSCSALLRVCKSANLARQLWHCLLRNLGAPEMCRMSLLEEDSSITLQLCLRGHLTRPLTKPGGLIWQGPCSCLQP